MELRVQEAVRKVNSNKPPENMIPVGRKTLTYSQMRQRAAAELKAKYQIEGEQTE